MLVFEAATHACLLGWQGGHDGVAGTRHVVAGGYDAVVGYPGAVGGQPQPMMGP